MHFPKILRSAVTCLLLASLLTSCQTAGGSAALGIGTALIGDIVGYRNPQAGDILKGVGAGILLYAAYQADQEQQAICRERARYAIRAPIVRHSSCRYVAVPVPKRQRIAGRPKSDLMLVDKQSGQPVSNKVYETTDGSQLQDGKVARIGGHEAVIYSRIQGV